MKHMKTVYEPGDIVTLAGTEFVVLGVEYRWTMPDELFILTKDTVRVSAFGDSNNYAESSLRSEIDKWLESMGKNGLDLDRIILRDIDLTTMDGHTEYGKLWVKAAPLTMDEARRYAYITPSTINWYWLATGGSVPLKGDDSYVLCVGGINSRWYTSCCSDAMSIRPALKIPSTLLDESADKSDLSNIPTDTLLEELRCRISEKEESR